MEVLQHRFPNNFIYSIYSTKYQHNVKQQKFTSTMPSPETREARDKNAATKCPHCHEDVHSSQEVSLNTE